MRTRANTSGVMFPRIEGPRCRKTKALAEVALALMLGVANTKYYHCTGVANSMRGSKSSSSQQLLMAPLEKIHSRLFKHSSSTIIFARTEIGCSSEGVMNNGF